MLVQAVAFDLALALATLSKAPSDPADIDDCLTELNAIIERAIGAGVDAVAVPAKLKAPGGGGVWL